MGCNGLEGRGVGRGESSQVGKVLIMKASLC